MKSCMKVTFISYSWLLIPLYSDQNSECKRMTNAESVSSEVSSGLVNVDYPPIEPLILKNQHLLRILLYAFDSSCKTD